MRMRGFLALTICIAGCGRGDACPPVSDSHSSFMHEFVISWARDTNFHRQHLHGLNSDQYRGEITERFVITGCDTFFPKGSYEYYLEFSNGRRATFQLYESKEGLVGSIGVYPRQP